MESFVQAARNRSSLVVALVAGLCCLAATCHAPVGFEISGDLDSRVHFAVSDLTEAETLVSVREVVVAQVAGGEVWHLNGQASLQSLVYGQTPDGMEVALGPVPLQPDGAYYIVVIGDSGWGREAKGTCRFGLDEAGRVHTEPGC